MSFLASPLLQSFPGPYVITVLWPQTCTHQNTLGVWTFHISRQYYYILYVKVSDAAFRMINPQCYLSIDFEENLIIAYVIAVKYSS